MTIKIFSNPESSALIPFRIEAGFTKALVSHNIPNDPDLTGIVSWVKQAAALKNTAVETTHTYVPGDNSFYVGGALSADTPHNISVSFMDELASSDAAILSEQYYGTASVLGNIYQDTFTTALPTTIIATSSLTSLTKVSGAVTVRIGLQDYSASNRVVIETSNAGGTGPWEIAFAGVPSRNIEIALEEGIYAARVSSIKDFTNGGTDTSAPQQFGGTFEVEAGELFSQLNAKTLSIDTDAIAFFYDAQGNIKDTAQTATITATSTNLVGDIVWGATGGIGTLESASVYSVTDVQFGASESVTITASNVDSGLSDSIILRRLQDGAGAISVILSNEAHTVPTDKNGDNGVFTGSETEIRVFEGSDELQFVVGTATKGQWSCVATHSNMSVASLTDSGSFASVNAATVLTTNSGTRTFTISGVTNSTNTAFSVAKVQTFSKNRQGINAPQVQTRYSVTGNAGTYHANFVVGDKYMEQSVDGGVTWLTGIKIVGEDGSYVDYKFANGATAPSYTNVDSPAGWADGPSTPTSGSFTWVLKGDKTFAGDLIGSWTPPSRISGGDGSPGDSVSVEYSVDGVNFHSVFATGDLFMRQRVGAGAWTAAIRIVGEGGNFIDYRFAVSATTPAVATTSINPGAAWVDAPPVPSTGEFIWFIRATKDSEGSSLETDWSTPVKISGNPGERGASQFHITGTAWDSVAAAAVARNQGDNVLIKYDTVQISSPDGGVDNGPFSETRFWVGPSEGDTGWTVVDQVISGTVLFPGSVDTTKLSARTITGDYISANVELDAPYITGGKLTIGDVGDANTLGTNSIVLDSSNTASPIHVRTPDGTTMMKFTDIDTNGVITTVLELSGGLAPHTINTLAPFHPDVLAILAPPVVGSTGGIFHGSTPQAAASTGFSTSVSIPEANTANVSIVFTASRFYFGGANYNAPRWSYNLRRRVVVGGTPGIYNSIASGAKTGTYQYITVDNYGEGSLEFDINVTDSTHGASVSDVIEYELILTYVSGNSGDLNLRTFTISQEVQGGGAAGVASSATFPYIGLTDAANASHPAMEPQNSPTNNSGWIRTPVNGFLPYEPDTASLGTSSYKFLAAHAINFYENGTALGNKYLGIDAKPATAGTADTADKVTMTSSSAAAEYKLVWWSTTGNTFVTDGVTVYPSIGRITAKTFKSTKADGTAPLVVASTTKVTNLNADTVDGYHASSFSLEDHTHTEYDQRVYNSANTYLGGYYQNSTTGQKPNNSVLGSGKLKLTMQNASNLGFGSGWYDVIYASAYTGGDVKKSFAFASSKSDNTSVYIVKQDFDSATWGTGYLLLNSGNYNIYAPTKAGIGASGTWPISIDGNADTVDGLHAHTATNTRNNEDNKLVRTDGSGYIQVGWINTTSGAHTSVPDKIFCTYSGDNYLRYQTPANFISNLDLAVTDANNQFSAAQTINANGDALNLHSVANGSGVGIKFSDLSPGQTQFGNIKYYHENALAYGGGDAFVISGNQTTVVLADGYLMFKNGLYIKPASSTSTLGTKVVDSSGNIFGVAITASGTVTGTDCIATSDERLKSEFRPITDALAKVCRLSGETYDMEGCDVRRAGHRAQGVEKELPEAVNYTDDEKLGKKLSLSLGAIPALHTEAIKELADKNDELKARLAKLEALVEGLING